MKRAMIGIIIMTAMVITLMAGEPVFASSPYSIIDLGTLGGTFSNARAINDNTQIVGGSDTILGESHAFLWENGVMTDLGTLGGANSSAGAINNLGQIAGMSQIISGKYHAFLWENDVMIDLGTLGGTSSYASSINETGQVVGYSRTASGETHAFLWENSAMIDLGTLGGSYSQANSINNRGQIVGSSTTASGETHAFLWENGIMTDLGTLAGGVSSGADDINEYQLIVGWSETTSGETRAFLWENGIMTDLGKLRDSDNFGQALAINDQMQIAGSSGDVANWDADHAFIWEDGSMSDLGTLGGSFSTAFGINSDEQIVGFSTTSEGEYHAVLWNKNSNKPPIADAGGPYAAFSGETITLDASNSYDPDGEILTYEWDLDLDGGYDDATGITTAVSFKNLGTLSVGLQVTDPGGLSDTDAADVIITPVPFIILDNFNRVNGPLSLNWLGYKSAYLILGNQVDVRGNGPIYWKHAFGADQKVAVTLTTVDPAGFEQDLLLKVQGQYGPNWGEGAIEVLYKAQAGTVTVWTFLPDILDWFAYPAIPVTFAANDQFGAQALSTGDVLIYKNGMEVGRVTLNSADQAFFNPKGGYIGLWFINARNTFFDDFGGGNIKMP